MKITTYHISILSFFLLLISCNEQRETSSFEKLKTEIYGIDVFTKIYDAQAASEALNKPIFLMFDNPNTTCCRRSTELLRKYILGEGIEKNFIVAILLVDDKSPLKNKYEAQFPNGRIKEVRTIGDENMLTQIEMFNTLSTPYHVIIDENRKNLIQPHGFFSNDTMIDDFFKSYKR